jgi:thymidine phosphorylase
MVEAQGGDPRVAEDPRRLLGSAEVEILPLAAPRDAVVAGIDALDCGLAVAALGGGRGADGSAPHPGVGIVLRCKPGERAEGGAPWVDVVHRRGDARGLAEARRHLERALRLAEPGEHPAPPPLVRDRLGDGVP